MPCSGMKSSVPAARGAATGCVLISSLLVGFAPFMVALWIASLKRDPLRGVGSLVAYGRHRPADRCAPPAGRAALLPEHRIAGLAVGACGQAPGRPARGGRGRTRLHGVGGSRALRVGDARV